MKRRTFINLGLSTVGVGLTGGTCAYLKDENMDRPTKKEGFVLADLHCHPSSGQNTEETLEMLISGLVGLTETNKSSNILTYSQALNFPHIEEIDPGILAKITYDDKVGYFMHTQEVLCDYHILILGLKENLPHFDDSRKATEEAHRRGGLVILNHPYVVQNPASFTRFRLINDEEEKKVRELCELIDEIEVFNAQNINPTLGIVIPNMKVANEKAVQLAKEYGFTGIAASDAHKRIEQVGTTGIYLSEEKLCLESIQEQIKKGKFQRYEHYVSRWSFVRGMFGI